MEISFEQSDSKAYIQIQKCTATKLGIQDSVGLRYIWTGISLRRPTKQITAHTLDVEISRQICVKDVHRAKRALVHNLLHFLYINARSFTGTYII
jgi:hypothetical protein